MELINQEIEIEPEVYKSLLNYCEKEQIEINDFIKSNLDLLGEY